MQVSVAPAQVIRSAFEINSALALEASQELGCLTGSLVRLLLTLFVEAELGQPRKHRPGVKGLLSPPDLTVRSQLFRV